jgi:hypothetical protein
MGRLPNARSRTRLALVMSTMPASAQRLARSLVDGTYTRAVPVNFVGQNVVFVVAMPPQAFDAEAFESQHDVGPVQTRIANNPELAVAQYQQLRVLVIPGQLQVDFKPDIPQKLISQVASYLLEQVATFRPTAVGFNGQLLIEVSAEAEEDPTSSVFSAQVLAARVQGEQPRGGFKVVYTAEGARWTFAVDPDLEQTHNWVASVNRHYDHLPTGDSADAAVTWFAGLRDGLPEQLRTLTSTTET